MKAILLAINHAYLFFGTTLYAGVLWALRFFWYESWDQIVLSDVQVHFIGPTSRATSFFWVVVPLMLLASIIMIISEWKKPTIILAIIGLLCILASSYVGQRLIIPVNKEIGAGLATEAELHTKLGLWMQYNTIRFWVMTIMWLAMMLYFIVKGDLLDALRGRQR